MVLSKLHEGLECTAKLMPIDEYRPAWLNKVNLSKISLVPFVTGCLTRGGVTNDLDINDDLMMPNLIIIT